MDTQSCRRRCRLNRKYLLSSRRRRGRPDMPLQSRQSRQSRLPAAARHAAFIVDCTSLSVLLPSPPRCFPQLSPWPLPVSSVQAALCRSSGSVSSVQAALCRSSPCSPTTMGAQPRCGRRRPACISATMGAQPRRTSGCTVSFCNPGK